KLKSLSWARSDDRQLLRDIAPRTFKIRIDSENRISIPDPLKSWAGIKDGDTVHVQGLIGHFEIWEDSRLNKRDGGGGSFESRLESRLGRSEDNGVQGL